MIDLPEFDTGLYEDCELRMAGGGAVLTIFIAENPSFVLSFQKVRWHQFTALPNCSAEMISGSYFKLSEVSPSSELAAFLKADQSPARAYRRLHHYRIFLDETGCHEFFAESAHAGPFAAADRLYLQPADFRVRYSFRPAEQGGRSSGPPEQGYRCDFLYEGQAPERDPVYYIWPEFEDPQGVPLPKGEVVPQSGTALMYVVQEPLRELHRERIHPGARGYLLEANRIVADVEVLDVLALSSGA